MSTQTVLARKRALDEIGGFDEALPRLQDWDLAVRLSRSVEARALKESLVEVWHSATSISADHEAYFLAYERLLGKLADERPAVRKHHLRILSRAALLAGKRRKAFEYAIQANRLGLSATEARLLTTAVTGERAWDGAIEILNKARRRARPRSSRG